MFISATSQLKFFKKNFATINIENYIRERNITFGNPRHNFKNDYNYENELLKLM